MKLESRSDEDEVVTRYVLPTDHDASDLLAQWSRFVAARQSVHLEQTWEWGQVRRADGWTPSLLVVEKNNLILGGAMLLVRGVGRVAKVGYVVRGPLVADVPAEEEGALTRLLIRELKRQARKLRLIYLVADLPYRAGGLAGHLVDAGFIPHLPRLPPSGTMNGALLIDLQQPEDDLWRGCRRTLRQNIQRSRQGGVVVRRGDERDIDLLWRLLCNLCERRKTTSNVSGPEIIRRLWHALRPSDSVRIDVAEIEGMPVVALMTVYIGSWVIPWRIGWSGAGRELYPEKLLYWHLLCDVCNRQFTVFDLNWIDTREVDAILKGETLPRTPNSGITFFKLGFGGDVVRLPGAFDYFPSPVLRWIVTSVGKRLLQSNLIASGITKCMLASRRRQSLRT